MGQNQSFSAKSEMDVRNSISQISEAHCINSAVNTSQIKTDIINSTLSGDLNIGRVQMINGASCSLKTVLSNELINELKSVQFGELEDIDERDPLTVLAEKAGLLTPWGAAAEMLSSLVPRNQTINQENIQKVVNEITQQMNSTCQNKIANENAPIITLIENSKVKGNTNITDEQMISNTSCVIENAARNYVKNDLENTQEGTIKRERVNGWISAIMGIIIMIAIIVVIGGLLSKGVLHVPGLSGGGRNRNATAASTMQAQAAPPSYSASVPAKR